MSVGAATMSDAEARLLRIKTGSVQRLERELRLYEKERTAEEAKVQSMRAAAADVYDIKQAVRLLGHAPARKC